MRVPMTQRPTMKERTRKRLFSILSSHRELLPPLPYPVPSESQIESCSDSGRICFSAFSGEFLDDKFAQTFMMMCSRKQSDLLKIQWLVSWRREVTDSRTGVEVTV
jgi:hypothetical protein